MTSNIPESCTVLVVGGGPGGSYTASALAREGVDTVVLEADIFPRYHIGESMLASIRHFLRFIDLEEKFDKYGFVKKLGASFKLNDKREAYTNFVAVNGPNGYAWNVVRSESDMLMFEHASHCRARVFDGIKVQSIGFDSHGQPTSATWSSRKNDSSGTVRFDYLVDATGRAGLLSTKYLKNRKFNQGLKNVASWGYWKGAATYAPGTEREGQPFFEALDDQSGWCWAIPLHDGTLSVGIVMRQDRQVARKKASGGMSMVEFYKDCLQLAPIIQSLVSGAQLVSDVKAASDWSYSASTYSGPNYRIVGDAGCFIDPFFSSGLHLAIASGLSAAITIQAARRGDCSAVTAAQWHTSKVTEGYTRFLLVVMMALKQIRMGSEPILSDFDQDGFDKAFGFFTPIIQGLADADMGGRLTQSRVSETVEFCMNAHNQISLEDREAVLGKLERLKESGSGDTEGGASLVPDRKEHLERLTEDELAVLRTIRARQMIRVEDTMNIDNFSGDVIDGFLPRLERGKLGLTKANSKENGGVPSYTESLLDTVKHVPSDTTTGPPEKPNGHHQAIGRPPPGIIDVHHHILPQDHVLTLQQSGAIPARLKAPQWTPALDLAFMDRHNIRASIISMVSPSDLSSSLGAEQGLGQATKSNTICADLVAAHPSRYGFFASLALGDLILPPSSGKTSHWKTSLSHALDALRADGILLQTTYCGKYLGDDVFRPLWEELDRRNAVVFVHPVVPFSEVTTAVGESHLPPFPIMDFAHETTRTAVSMILGGVMARFVNVRIILSHGGGTLPFVAGRIANLVDRAGLMPLQHFGFGGGEGPERKKTAAEFLDEARLFYFDLALMGFEDSGSRMARRLVVEFARKGHVLWGSDFPFMRDGGGGRGGETAEGGETSLGWEDEEIEVRQSVEVGAAVKLFPRFAGGPGANAGRVVEGGKYLGGRLHAT